MRNLIQREAGRTVLELIVALGIGGMMLVSLGATSSTLHRGARGGVAQLSAVSTLDAALTWLNRDALMAQSVSPTPGTGFPLRFDWMGWDTSSHSVTYSLSSGSLHRVHLLNGVQESDLIVARTVSADPLQSSASFADGVLTLKLSATGNSGAVVRATRSTQTFARSNAAQ